jgi:hypothetical protein
MSMDKMTYVKISSFKMIVAKMTAVK